MPQNNNNGRSKKHTKIIGGETVAVNKHRLRPRRASPNRSSPSFWEGGNNRGFSDTQTWVYDKQQTAPKQLLMAQQLQITTVHEHPPQQLLMAQQLQITTVHEHHFSNFL